jgi:urease accessory protein
MKPLDVPQHALAPRGWQAQLRADFTREKSDAKNNDDAARTVLRTSHSGPLRLQKPLYPEGGGICHAIIVHPPGGIASGDALHVDVRVANAAHALATTPGATKWYRKGDAGAAHQTVKCEIAAGGVLEWLPQEAIAYEHCDAHAFMQFDLERGALCAGWDMWVLGRKAFGEVFESGRVLNRLRICVDGVPVLLEQSLMQAHTIRTVAALGQHHCCGVFWVYGAQVGEAQLEALRTAHPDLAFTCPQENLLLARGISSEPEGLMHALRQCWLATRPMLLGTPAQMPRIWNT